MNKFVVSVSFAICAFASDIAIQHLPDAHIEKTSTSIIISATGIGDIEKIGVWAKLISDEDLQFFEMTNDFGEYFVEISGALIDTEIIQYHFEAWDSLGNIFRNPDIFGEFYSFRMEEKKVVFEPELLNPEPNGIVGFAPLPIVIAIYAENDPVKPETIRVFFNGEDVTIGSFISSNLVTYVPTKQLPEGTNSVSIFVHEKEFVWRFQVESGIVPEKEPFKMPFGLKATIKAESQLDKFFYSDSEKQQPDNRPFDAQRINFKLSGKTEQFRFGLISSFNSHFDENARLIDAGRQPLGRNRLQISDKMFDLYIGDSNPMISELTMKGTKVQGLNAAVRLGWLRMNYLNGQTKLPIEIQESGSGTFQRNVLGFKTGIDFFNHFELGASIFQFSDDTTSITVIDSLRNDYSPKHNLTVGLHSHFHIWEDQITILADWAGSAMNDNTYSKLDEDTREAIGENLVQAIEKYFPLNSTILENLSFVLPDPTADIDPVKLVKDNLTKGTYFLEFKTPLPYSKFKASVKRVPDGFSSLGNPSLQTDIQGYRADWRGRFLKRKITLSARIEQNHDNLAAVDQQNEGVVGSMIVAAKSQTTYSKTRSLNLSIAPNNLSSLNLSYRQMNRHGELVDKTDTTAALPSNNVTGTWTIAPSGKYDINEEISASVNANVMLMRYRDKTDPSGKSDFRNSSFLMTSNCQLPQNFGFSVGFGITTNAPIIADSAKTRFRAFDCKLSRKWIDRKFNTAIGFNLVKGEKTDNSIDNMKFNLKLGLQYKFSRKASISLNGSWRNVADKINPSEDFSEFRSKLRLQVQL